MKDQLDRRLTELKSEFQAGQQMLAEVEAKEANLRESLLRISGAIQVLEEELSKLAEPADVESKGESEATGTAAGGGG